MEKRLKAGYKRPLAVASTGFVFVIALAHVQPALVVCFLLAIVLGAFLLYVRFPAQCKEGRWLFLFALLFLFSFTASIVSLHAQFDTVRQLKMVREAKKDTVIRLQVREVLRRGSAARIVGRILDVDGESVSKVSLLFYLYDEEVDIGKELFLTGVHLFPGQFDRGGTIRLNAKVKTAVQSDAKEDAFLVLTKQMKSTLRYVLYYSMPDHAADVAIALLTGEKDEIAVRDMTLLRRAGVSHIVVVSGMHITVFLWLFARLLMKLSSSVLRGVLAFTFIFFLMAFYGFSPSVVRACLVGGLVFFGDLFDLKTDSLTSLSVAAAVILLLSPRMILDISFQLSFACCFAIVAINPLFQAKAERTDEQRKKNAGLFKRLADGLFSAFSLSAVISAVTLPILLLHNLPISLVAPLANPPIVALLPLLLVSLLLLVFVFPLSSFLASLLGALAAILIEIVYIISGFFASWRYAALDPRLDGRWVWGLFILIGLLAAFGKLYSRRAKLGLVVLFPLLFLLPLQMGNNLYRADQTEISLLNGNALLIAEGQEALLVLQKVRAADVAYLQADLLARQIHVDQVLLLKGARLAEQSVRTCFPNSDLLDTMDGSESSVLTVGKASVRFDNQNLFLTCRGTTMAVLSQETGENNADITLFWRSANHLPESGEGLLILYDDEQRDEDGPLIRYGYGDSVEILCSNKDFRVRLR